MIHKMNLHPEPFKMIRDGSKTIELRLNDEKRSLIQVGDSIEFTNTSNQEEKIHVNVIQIHRFGSFDELYKQLRLDQCGYTPSEVATAKPSDMLVYYPQEKQNQYGVLGIEVELQKTHSTER